MPNTQLVKRKKKIKKKKKIQLEIQNNDAISFSPVMNKGVNPKIKEESDIGPININLENNNIIKHKQNNFTNKEILEYNDNELNSLLYEKALIYDKRTFIQLYISLLKVNHLLIFSFYINKKDYNSQVIKIFLFFFFFSVHLAINALFFNDDTLHRIYMDEGAFNFIYQIPQIIYSSIISVVIDIIIKYLAL